MFESSLQNVLVQPDSKYCATQRIGDSAERVAEIRPGGTIGRGPNVVVATTRDEDSSVQRSALCEYSDKQLVPGKASSRFAHSKARALRPSACRAVRLRLRPRRAVVRALPDLFATQIVTCSKDDERTNIIVGARRVRSALQTARTDRIYFSTDKLTITNRVVPHLSVDATMHRPLRADQGAPVDI